MVKSVWDDHAAAAHAGTKVWIYSDRGGAPVYAAASGDILYSNFRGGNAGNGVHIKHPGGVNTKYFHLDRLAGLQPGDSVVAGQLIGYNGSSGNADAGGGTCTF